MTQPVDDWIVPADDWVVPPAREPVFDAVRGAGGAVAGAVGRVADVPNSWWSRRARDVIEGVAAPISAAVEAMNPGLAAQRALMPRAVQQRFAPSGSDLATAAADRLGLARPTTPGEQMTSAVVQGAAGAIPTLGAGLLARAPAAIGGLTGAASQFVGGATGGAATEGAAQAGYGPVTQTVAGLAGGIGGAVGAQAAGGALRGAGAAVQPFTAGGRERMVTDTLVRASDDPATLAARIQQGLDAPDARLPDSPVTTAQAARDPRLLRVESSIAQGMPEIATPIRDVQIGRARAQEAAITGMGDGSTPDVRGAQVRGELARPGQTASGLRGEEQSRRAQVSRAYEAIDPEGTARLPLAPVQSVIQSEMATRWGAGAGDMPAPLRSLFDDLGAAGDVQPWAYLQRIRSRAAEIAGDPAAGARVNASAGRVRDAIDQTAEAAAVPVQRAGAPVSLSDLDRQDAAQGVAARPDVRAVVGEGRTATADGRAGGISLAQFVRQRGGFRERPGEVADGQRMPGLFNRNGLSIDRAMQDAIDAGYYPGRTIQTDNVTPGATLTRAEFLRDIGEDVNGRTRIYPEQRRAAREDVASRDALRNEVERELDAQGLGLRDSPDRIFAATRPVDEAAPAAPMDRPDGAIVIPEGQRFTPEQAQRWRDATALRRRLGQDFERDTTGVNATGRILDTADYGAPRLPDERVSSAALANVNSLRQVLRASNNDPQVRTALQGEFIDRMTRATMGASEVIDSGGVAQRTMSAAGFRRFWDQNQDMARTLFDAPAMRRLELLSRDFSEASWAANTGAARGSQTAQNLSVASLIARASNGLLDPSNPTVATFMRPLAWAYRLPEQATREVLGQAMADPRFAAMLLARASPNSIRRATAYVEQNLSARLQEAAITGGARQAIRTGSEEERRRSP